MLSCFVVSYTQRPSGFKAIIKSIFNYACDATLSVYPHRASLKNMLDHGGINITSIIITSIIITNIMETSQASYSPEYITPTQKNHEYLINTNLPSLTSAPFF
jgi:hypothetical protein